MLEAYRSGDPYLAFGKQAGLAPPDATKQATATPRPLQSRRARALYGMGPETLARRIGRPHEARDLCAAPGDVPDVLAVVGRRRSSAVLTGGIETVFGWRLRVGADSTRGA